MPLGPSLHLKTAVSALDDATVLLSRRGVDPAVFAGLAAIHVDPAEPFAANVLRLPEQLIINAAFAATRGIVEAHARSRGVAVLAVDIGEFGKAEAGLSCLSLLAR